ncbi:MAG: tripartite tricarboxylate transporter substrate binding protein [Burkholderiales bacterium]|nr:tripartite tricarboxylate transporter substrate binding protein [Burkholderiales bacterium]
MLRAITLRPLFGMFLALAACAVQAQAAWPNRPVRLIIPFPAGTSPDVVMRIATPAVSQMWGQQIVIENRTGASGNIGAQAVATAPADGYTLLYTVNSVICANPHLFAKMPFDPLKAFVPVSLVVNLGYVLVARNGLPAATLPDLIALAKAQPGKLTYSSAGVGVGTHIVMELFLGMTGTKMLHIPMTTPALQSVYSGETDLTMTPYTTGVPAAKGGKARGLGVSLARRLDSLPDVPAIAEVVPGFVGDAWHGLFAPAGTPQAIVDRVAADFARVLGTAEVRRKLADIGLETIGNTPAEFAAIVQKDHEKWGRVIRDAGIKAD